MVLSSWVVLKFGGTSVSTAERWRCICNQIRSHLESSSSSRVWVTISALSQITNKLTQALALASERGSSHMELTTSIALQHFSLAYEVGLLPTLEGIEDSAELYNRWQHLWLDSIFSQDLDGSSFSRSPINFLLPKTLHPLVEELKNLVRMLEGIRLTEEASPRIQARVLAFGELLSTHLGKCILDHYGLTDVERVDARELLVSDNASAKSEEDKYLQAEVLPRLDREQAEVAANGKRVVLTQGFIASTSTGATCVLGRGGSDTSGSLFASLLGALKYEIWTDVHGMFTTDPRFVPDARLIKNLDYREAQELAAMGAKVLHPRCINPVQWGGIPLEIRNTNDPKGEKTVIHPATDADKAQHGSPKILAVVKRQNMTTLSITAFDMCGTSGFLAKVFAPFETCGISVDLIATSQFSVTVTLDHIPGGIQGAPFNQLLEALNEHSKVRVFEDCSVVSIVGRRLRKALAELGCVFSVLENYDVLLLSESAEDLNLSFVLQQKEADEVVARMHSFFFPGDNNVSSAKVVAVDGKPSRALPPRSPHPTTSTSETIAGVLPTIPGPVVTALQQSTFRRSPSRDLLFGPTWQSLLNDAQT
ncbi:aspartate kinase [Plasmopara halstedii]|uniref:aspartate kinase n=1 Tax=Plasmopara halstedii TaxID=4781 RepID=A0A0P1B6A7_PLAHL|nr:aspartate kinase [Plasmopara halstedii]CEG50356.1 aspartate kinase [Plasmopara halstedii]|eukprot:XP_024586725.1 aspartate kinase [Plasmopara halstedii]